MSKSIGMLPPNWLGDVVMAQPAIHAISNHFPDQPISLFGQPWLEDLIPFLNLNHASYEPKLKKHNHIFLFRNSFHAAWQAYRSGSTKRYGFKHECRSPLLTHAYQPTLNMKYEHHRDYFLDLVAQAGIPITERDVKLSIHNDDLQQGYSLLKTHNINPERAICIAPGAQFGGAKRYPQQSYAYVLKWLSEQGWQPVILGTPSERNIGDECLQYVKATAWNAAGKTSLKQALQLIASSKLTLCNDSGLMHVSAGLGKPTVGIFGATEPSRTAPSGTDVSLLYKPAICSPCLKRECNTSGQPCMGNILPEYVLQACLDKLNI
jgi:heptosyltransferase-2